MFLTPPGSRADRAPSQIVLGSILALAAVLRFWALGHGIPYALGVDEPEVLERAVNMMKSGSLNPHFFDYPSLYIYIQLVTACLRFLYGAFTGMWASLEQAGPEDFYVWGRAVTALFGVVTVWIVYRTGRWWDTRVALLAAGFMAVLPLHVRQSHYVLTDVPLTAFVAVTMLLALRANDLGTVSAFAWTGVAVGMATATKYNGAVAIVMPLMACLTTRKAARPWPYLMAVTAVACGATFLLFAPYSVLDLPAFLNGFARLSSIYRSLPEPAEPGWLTYLKHLRLVLGWPAMLLLAGGLTLGLVRAVRDSNRFRWLAVTIFPICYFGFVSDQRLIFARYLLPAMPGISVLVALAIVSAADALPVVRMVPARVRAGALAALAIAAFVIPTIQAVQFDQTIGRRSTVELAHEWIQDNVPRKSRIAVETRALLLSPSDYAAQNFPRLISDHLTHASRDYETYIREGYQYMVASSQAYGPIFDAPQKAFDEYAAYRRLFDQSTELIRFTPSVQHPGPELRVFRLSQVASGGPGSTP
jgi:4-amino-4-deoxy-L-arabinose transferase-like glycosyltransferase